GLRVPWAVDLAPDGRLFVTERAGRVRIVQLGPGGGLRADPWATVPASTSGDGEKGLLGIALDPSFASNSFVYLYYSYAPSAGVPVWSLGHRNVQGIAWHPDTGALYETEHGPSDPFPNCCNDEVNLIVAGGNYGWPTVRGAAGDPRFRDPLIDSGRLETWAPSGAAFATK